MEIHIAIWTTEPLAGAARTESAGPLPFEGWLELLHVLSTLIGPGRSSAGEKLGASPDRLPKEGGRYERTNYGAIDDGPIPE